VAGILIVASVLLLAGYRRKDGRLFFTGLSSFGLLILLFGIFMVMVGDFEVGSGSSLALLVVGGALGVGIAVVAIGTIGLARPSILWPDDSPHAQKGQEKF